MSRLPRSLPFALGTSTGSGITTNTRTAPVRLALSSSTTHTAPLAMVLSATRSRTAPTVLLLGPPLVTRTRTAPALFALSTTRSRTAPLRMALSGVTATVTTISGAVALIDGTPVTGVAVSATPARAYLQLIAGTWDTVLPVPIQTTTDINGAFALALPATGVVLPAGLLWTVTITGVASYQGALPINTAATTLRALVDSGWTYLGDD